MQFGLIALLPGGPAAIDLHSVNVEAKIIDFCAEVEITQHYVNTSTDLCEGMYVFPLDERAAICGLEVRIGDTVTVAEIQKKEEAKKTYDDAIARGDSAQLLEQKRDDVFQMRVGNLRPNEACTVKITYVADLKVDGDDVLFLLPTAVAPRYNPPTEKDPLVDTGAFGQAAKGLSIHLRMQMGSAITTVRSETHTIRFTGGAGDARRGEAVLGQQYTHLEKDFVALVGTALPHAPRVCIETSSEGSRVAMVTLVPQFDLPDCKCEFVFVVDRSGSMQGEKIDQARSAMQLFLRSLPADCFFNIVGFGSNFKKLFPESRRYDQSSLLQATEDVTRLYADLGGTEILQPLTDVLGAASVPGYARQVFVLTDGEVGNTKEVISLVARSLFSRVFAMGLGPSASHELVEGIGMIPQCTTTSDTLARAGRGTAMFVTSNDSLDRKVVQQLRDSLQPSLTDVTVDWGITPVEQPAAALAAAAPAVDASAGQVVSLHSHPLVRVACPYLVGSWHCDRCLRWGTAEVHHCAFCSYDLCDQCMAWAAAVQPPVAMATDEEVLGNLLGFTAQKRQPAALTYAPAVIPPIFSKSRFIVFCLIAPGQPEPRRVTITAATPAGKLQTVVEATIEDYVAGDTLHKLAARAMIRDLEQLRGAQRDLRQFRTDEEVKAELERLSLKYHLASSVASFVAVQRRSDGFSEVLPELDALSLSAPGAAAAFSGARGRGGLGLGKGGAKRHRKVLGYRGCAPRKQLATKACRKSAPWRPPVKRQRVAGQAEELLSTAHEHPLRLELNPYGVKLVAQCDKCQIQVKGDIYNCTPCDFDLCFNCAVKTIKGSVTTTSHPHDLALCETSPYKSVMWKCDGCSAQGLQHVYHCAACKYDLCPYCAARTTVAPPPPPPYVYTPPPPPAPVVPTDPFMRVIMRQQFDGHFTLGDAAEALGTTAADLEASMPADARAAAQASDVWGTAMVVALLERRFADRKDDCFLVLAKAQQWLSTVAHGTAPSIQAAAMHCAVF